MTRRAFLTIDDSPSPAFRAKLKFLLGLGLPATFFILGQNCKAQFREDLLYALESGFLLGNHSWTHPDFASISLAQAEDEILRSHELLLDLHAEAGLTWKLRLFRFPFLSKGGQNRLAIRKLLAQLGYVQPLFAGLTQRPFFFGAGDLDVSATFDSSDWALTLGNGANAVHSLGDILDRMNNDKPAAGSTLHIPGSSHIVLLHDHFEISEIFEPLVRHLVGMGFEFDLPRLAAG